MRCYVATQCNAAAKWDLALKGSYQARIPKNNKTIFSNSLNHKFSTGAYLLNQQNNTPNRKIKLKWKQHYTKKISNYKAQLFPLKRQEIIQKIIFYYLNRTQSKREYILQ